MNAVIYAAGSAFRMGPQCVGLPKILLQVGAYSLLEWHARHLSTLGIRDVHVVTGYCHEQVAGVLKDLNQRYRVTFQEIHNPHYREGSVISVAASLPVLRQVEKEVLVMDGDVFYGVALLRRLVESAHPTAMLVDFSYRAQDDDPVLTPIRAGRPFELLKRWQGDADRVGESVGFFKINAKDLPLFIDETLARSEGDRRSESYDEVLRALVKADRFRCEDVSDLPWTEIDFPYDLDHARNDILPLIG